jgi:hypothetical protein
MDNVQKLILDFVRENDPNLRNSLALSLASTKDERAYRAIRDQISNPLIANQRGTLVHALREFNCYKDDLLFFVDLILNGNWEVAHEAMAAICEIDEATGEQVNIAYLKIEKSELDPMEDWRVDLMRELKEMFS